MSEFEHFKELFGDKVKLDALVERQSKADAVSKAQEKALREFAEQERRMEENFKRQGDLVAFLCVTCGSLVADRKGHLEWHDAVGAAMAQGSAAYQRGQPLG